MLFNLQGSRARSLYKAGLRTPLAIAEASIPEIVKALFESSSWATEGDLWIKLSQFCYIGLNLIFWSRLR